MTGHVAHPQGGRLLYAESQVVGVWWLAVNGDGATPRDAEGSDAEGERAPWA
jgi:hypothetical protein